MAYDPKLAQRVRTATAARRGVTERQMFGGLAFLLHGKMFVGVLGDELLARVGPDAHEAALAKAHVRVMDFTGRPMVGYVFVGAKALAGTALRRWVDACAAHVAALPEVRRTAPRRSRTTSSPSTPPRGRSARPRGARRAR